jgi:hypothetical protein
MADLSKADLSGIIQNRDKKFDLQLSQALIDERRLAEIFAGAKIERIELKSESSQWEQTGHIAIEYEQDGKPSGIATTEAAALAKLITDFAAVDAATEADRRARHRKKHGPLSDLDLNL